LPSLSRGRTISILEKKYSFLKHIVIKDPRFVELDEPVSVMSELDNVSSYDIGQALYDIIKTINANLGKNAGFFFIKELKNSIEDEYNTRMINMGLDLGLMQLEFEINEMTKKL
jgi:hypothetical protein